MKRRYDLSSLRFVTHGARPARRGQARDDRLVGAGHQRVLRRTETGIRCGIRPRRRWPSPAPWAADRGRRRQDLRPTARQRAPRRDRRDLHADRIPDFDYHGKADKRREVGRDGLITVGDVGYLDEDGYLFLCDRKRDMVISGGVNIYPAEIEAVLIGMDGVRDCAVFGIPDEEFGERLRRIEPQAGADRRGAVQEFLRGALRRFKVPKESEAGGVRARLPREDSGKIFKRKLVFCAICIPNPQTKSEADCARVSDADLCSFPPLARALRK